jgi:hypothetical protein
MPVRQPGAAPITSLTRRQAVRFLSRYENELPKEIELYLKPDNIDDAVVEELFGANRAQVQQRFTAFMQSMVELSRDGSPDPQVIRHGLDIIAGIVSASEYTGERAAADAAVKQVARDFRSRNEVPSYIPLSGEDKRDIRREATQRARKVTLIDQDTEFWKDAARQMVAIADGVGVNTAGYADRLGLARFQE